MRNQRDRDNQQDRDKEQMAVLAVLAAAAREAEELLNIEPDLDASVVAEADRRLQLFMRTARHLAR
jgi:hypothetical protein